MVPTTSHHSPTSLSAKGSEDAADPAPAKQGGSSPSDLPVQLKASPSQPSCIRKAGVNFVLWFRSRWSADEMRHFCIDCLVLREACLGSIV